MRRLGSLVVAVLLLAGVAEAQGRQNRRALPPDAVLGDAGGVSPAEIQRLFDAYPAFLSRVRALQDTRRRADVERTRRMQILRRLTNDHASSDNDLRTQLREFDDFDTRVAADLARAQEAVLQVLTLRQQARYRLFQEQMERRKVDLLMRARQANRARQAP